MKIVHLIPAFNRGGTERLVINLSKEQISKGHQVKIFSFSDLNLYLEDTKDLDIVTIEDSYVIYKLLGRNSHNLTSFESQLREFKPDIIHSHSYWTDLLVNAIGILNSGYISHFHLYYEEHEFHKIVNIQTLKRFAAQQMLFREYDKRQTQFVGVSNDVCSFYKNNFPKRFSDRIHLLPNFLAFKPITYSKKLPIDRPVKLLTVGRLIELKNHKVLLDLCHSLKDSGLEFHLSIAGEGPLKTELTATVARLGLQDSVSLLGNVSDIVSLYRESDLYLHPSKLESFGLVILEAMAFGLPCIVNESAVGANDAITSQEGIYVEMDNIDLTAQTVIDLLKNKEQYEKMSIASINRAKMFNVGDFWMKLEKIYMNSMTDK